MVSVGYYLGVYDINNIIIDFANKLLARAVKRYEITFT